MIPNKTIIELLIKNQKIDQAIADKLLKESQSLNKSVEEILYERNIISEKDLAQIKGDYYKIPVKYFTNS